MNIGRYSKFISAVLGAVVVGVNTFTPISPGEIQGWVNVGATILAAAGVFQFRNSS